MEIENILLNEHPDQVCRHFRKFRKKGFLRPAIRAIRKKLLCMVAVKRLFQLNSYVPVPINLKCQIPAIGMKSDIPAVILVGDPYLDFLAARPGFCGNTFQHRFIRPGNKIVFLFVLWFCQNSASLIN